MNNGHSGFFLYGGRGRIFCLHHSPAEKSQLIIVAPFAEEMNKSRRMFTLLARELRPRGYGVLVPDLYGTGDSDGDFADARWEIWKADVAAAAAYLSERQVEVSVLGLRLGALLAMECVCAEMLKVHRAILWQPVVSGKAFMTQFLRLRIAANMAAAETTQALRARLAAGEALEVAGYTLAPDMVCSLDSAALGELTPKDRLPLHWMEVSQSALLSPASRPVIEKWKAKAALSETLLVGPPFWATAEITLVPELIERTLAFFD